jgi:hypothetical protein
MEDNLNYVRAALVDNILETLGRIESAHQKNNGKIIEADLVQLALYESSLAVIDRLAKAKPFSI